MYEKCVLAGDSEKLPKVSNFVSMKLKFEGKNESWEGILP